jgi:hypothetical protein
MVVRNVNVLVWVAHAMVVSLRTVLIFYKMQVRMHVPVQYCRT